MFAAGNFDSVIVTALFGFILIVFAVMNTLRIRAYGLNVREWKHNYRLSRGLSMVTRVGLFFLGVVLIGLAIYNGVTGR